MPLTSSPHISISAVTESDHIDPLIDQFNAQSLGSFGHTGAISYLAHNGTADGQPHPVPKFQPRSISSEAHLRALIEKVGNRATNVLHIDCVNYEGSGTGTDAAHSTQELQYHVVTPVLTRLLAVPYRQNTCRTVQINGLAEVQDLDMLLQVMPDLRVIASIGPSVSKNGTSAVLDYIGQRRAFIHDVLPDLSVGQGTVIRPTEAGEQMRDIRKAFPDLGLGIAGGLGPKNVEEIVRQVRAASGINDFSVDAESGLRNTTNQLDLDATHRYIRDAAQGFTM